MLKCVFFNRQAFFLICLVSVFFFNGCTTETEETSTQGVFRMAVDESFQPIVEAEREAFTATYPKVKISAVYVSEGKAINLLLADSVKLIVISRNLDTTERNLLLKNKIIYKSFYMATDGVALVIHRSNQDSSITTGQLRDIFTGKAKTWDHLFKNSLSKDSIIVVFDKGNSSNLSYMKTKLGISKEDIPVFSAKSNANVIEYVKNHPGAIGVVGVNWMSDLDSHLADSLKSQIRVMWVADTTSAKEIEYFLPYASLLTETIDTSGVITPAKYPLTRKLYAITRESGTGPASGFMSYIGSDIGQRIILKSGLVPAIIPGHIIKIREKRK